MNVKEWITLQVAIREANERVRWKDRVPYAHWKGKSYVSQERRDLMQCNFSDKYDPMVHLYEQVYISQLWRSIYLTNVILSAGPKHRKVKY